MKRRPESRSISLGPSIAAQTAMKRLLARHEDRICSCGAGHGSLEGHLDWCAWVISNESRK